ncbi:MAG: pilin [Patescibacteria group bacterium]
MFKTKIKKSLILIFGLSSPLLALAVTHGPTFGTVATNFTARVLAPLVGLLLTAALVVFFWGMVKYINSLSSEKDKQEGKQLMIWGVVALFVMVSVWGLVNLLQGTFLGDVSTTPFPVIQMPSGGGTTLGSFEVE